MVVSMSRSLTPALAAILMSSTLLFGACSGDGDSASSGGDDKSATDAKDSSPSKLVSVCEAVDTTALEEHLNGPAEPTFRHTSPQTMQAFREAAAAEDFDMYKDLYRTWAKDQGLKLPDKQIDLMIEMRVAEAGSEDAFWLDTQDYYQHTYEVCQFSGPANAAGQSRFLEVRVFVDAPDGALPRVSEDTEDKSAKSAKLKQIPGTDAVVYSSTNVKKDLTDHYVYIDAGRFSAVLDGLAWSSSSGPSGYEPEVDVKPIVLAIQDALKKA